MPFASTDFKMEKGWEEKQPYCSDNKHSFSDTGLLSAIKKKSSFR
jgi:hypothetical protein